MSSSAFAGFALGFSLILAIGAQNAFVLRQGAAARACFCAVHDMCGIRRHPDRSGGGRFRVPCTGGPMVRTGYAIRWFCISRLVCLAQFPIGLAGRRCDVR